MNDDRSKVIPLHVLDQARLGGLVHDDLDQVGVAVEQVMDFLRVGGSVDRFLLVAIDHHRELACFAQAGGVTAAQTIAVLNLYLGNLSLGHDAFSIFGVVGFDRFVVIRSR